MGTITTTLVLTLVEKLASDLKYIVPSTVFDSSSHGEDVDLKEIAKRCNDKSLHDPDWSLLAGRIYTTALYNILNASATTFSSAMHSLRNNLDPSFLKFVYDHAPQLDAIIKPERDMKFDYFGIRTLEKSYLGRIRENGKQHIYETPQYMYLRMAVMHWYPDMNRIERMYDDLSLGNYSHASPTMFNAGKKRSALSSCFKTTTLDTLTDIAKRWHYEALISKTGGGIGKDFSRLRHSEIGTHGMSKGVIPWLKIDNEIVCAVDQDGMRKGSLAAYLKVWHVDIFEFVEAKLPIGDADKRAHDLFYGVMVYDLFMKRVENDEMWSLFCPGRADGLCNVWGKDFEVLYTQYEKEGLYTRQVKARDLWYTILQVQLETGTPYICYIDAMNRKCNQTHNGKMVDISNLCTEITGVTDENEIFSCNLGSVCLSSCVVGKQILFNTSEKITEDQFSFEKLARLTRDLVRNINRGIDINYYHADIPEIRKSNFTRRPIGIGVQGLANVFAMLGLDWEDPVAHDLHKRIFETMYIAGIRESVELAKEEGMYTTFPGSPASKGFFQFDLWELERHGLTRSEYTATQSTSNKRYQPLTISVESLEKLRTEMMHHGLRNSLLFALMPTASSAHILGNNESFEPFNQMIFKRSVLGGEFLCVNKHFVTDARKMGIWGTDLVQYVMKNKGSVQGFSPVTSNTTYFSPPEEGGSGYTPQDFERFLKKYKGIYEIKQKLLLDLCYDRSFYVCQSQSMNCHMAKPDATLLNAYHFYGWKLGLKTGMYYLRQQPAFDAINFALSGVKIETVRNVGGRKYIEREGEVCTSCVM